VVGFVLHPKPVWYCSTFLHPKPVWYCRTFLHPKPMWYCPTFLHPKPVWYCPTFLQHVLCLSSLSFPYPTACLLGKSLHSPSSFGREDWEVEIWIMSNFSCLWGKSLLLVFIWSWRLRSRDLFVIIWLFSSLFPFCPSLSFLHRQFFLGVGVSALRPWHGVVGKVFPWKMGLWGDLLIIKSILVL
jgi:hypothetical protein